MLARATCAWRSVSRQRSSTRRCPRGGRAVAERDDARVRADHGRDVQGDAALGGAAAGDLRGGGRVVRGDVAVPAGEGRERSTPTTRNVMGPPGGAGSDASQDRTGVAVRTQSRGSPIFGVAALRTSTSKAAGRAAGRTPRSLSSDFAALCAYKAESASPGDSAHRPTQPVLTLSRQSRPGRPRRGGLRAGRASGRPASRRPGAGGPRRCARSPRAPARSPCSTRPPAASCGHAPLRGRELAAGARPAGTDARELGARLLGPAGRAERIEARPPRPRAAPRAAPHLRAPPRRAARREPAARRVEGEAEALERGRGVARVLRRDRRRAARRAAARAHGCSCASAAARGGRARPRPRSSRRAQDERLDEVGRDRERAGLVDAVRRGVRPHLAQQAPRPAPGRASSSAATPSARVASSRGQA